MDTLQNLLRGIHVVEFAQLIAGPLCALNLADLGATVTKVESPYGDYTRTWARPGAESAIFHMLNRGKRSVVLDPRSETDKARAFALVHSADVVVESHGDAMIGVYGIGYDQIAADRRDLIWCSISGLGRGSGGRAIDMTLQASMGMSALTGDAGGPPLRGAMPFVDIMTALYASQSVIGAFLRVERGARWVLFGLRDARCGGHVNGCASGLGAERILGAPSDGFGKRFICAVEGF
jgi:crotonobetainyl-CoA:carnitine CoA-transferase CaiB-like acyl-CoA transferase